MIREAKCRWVKKGYGFYNTKKLGQLPAGAPTKSYLKEYILIFIMFLTTRRKIYSFPPGKHILFI